MAKQIRAGTVCEIYGRSGEWMFIDLGLGEKSKSNGVLQAVGQSKCVTFRKTVMFGEAVNLVKRAALRTTPFPLNLVLEAPLSVTFDGNGNPTGRVCDTKDGVDRPWHNQAALRMIVAAGYMMQKIAEHRRSMKRDIVLYEGFVSFKRSRSAHIKDAEVLKDAVWKPNPRELFAPEKLLLDPAAHKIRSSFKIMGIDLGIPPVIRPNHNL